LELGLVQAGGFQFSHLLSRDRALSYGKEIIRHEPIEKTGTGGLFYSWPLRKQQGKRPQRVGAVRGYAEAVSSCRGTQAAAQQRRALSFVPGLKETAPANCNIDADDRVRQNYSEPIRNDSMDKETRKAAISARIEEQIGSLAQAICKNRHPVAEALVLDALANQLATEETIQPDR
jgi:hypothetical protein